MDVVFTDLRKKLSNYSEPRKYCPSPVIARKPQRPRQSPATEPARGDCFSRFGSFAMTGYLVPLWLSREFSASTAPWRP